MKPAARFLLALAIWALPACAGDAQQTPSLVRSSDPDLRELAAALLPDLARRSGLELKAPVRLEKRTRAELERYLRHKLDERLPESVARRTVAAYALLGLVPDTLDLRGLMMDLYTEQVAGFYEPDSVALFVLDDQPAAVLQPLLVHELVHAVQDQSVDLRALTDPDLGNDRATAAQAAIEGHATLVMLEYLSEQMRGTPVDLGRVRDFAGTLRPALEAMQGQFPALAGAPAVVRQTLLFPYVEGAGFVQDLWNRGGRTAPFGTNLPLSTEQILTRDLADAPVQLHIAIEGGRSVHEDDLGRLEAGVFLETHVGEGQAHLADGWGGDRYALVELPGGGRGLAWAVVWDEADARGRWVAAVAASLGSLPSPATVEALEVEGRPAALLRVGLDSGVRVRAGIRP